MLARNDQYRTYTRKTPRWPAARELHSAKFNDIPKAARKGTPPRCRRWKPASLVFFFFFFFFFPFSKRTTPRDLQEEGYLSTEKNWLGEGEGETLLQFGDVCFCMVWLLFERRMWSEVERLDRERDFWKRKSFELLSWQLSNCGFLLENQRQFFHGTK